MRNIFRKLNNGEELAAVEYGKLLSYIDSLMLASPESYAVFYEQYASLLYRDYSTFIPRFRQGFDDLLNHLLQQPEALQFLQQTPLPLQEFPADLHPYLRYTFSHQADTRALQMALGTLDQLLPETNILPCPRKGPMVYKYEDDNEGKEAGLQTHFARLERYSFVTRLQTYRYLTRNKARTDRFEYIDTGLLGGIFTNKDKSIYYLVFLSEKDARKAENACRVLNTAFYS
ncbi:hypothetical protein [Syntrophomonas curvata]